MKKNKTYVVLMRKWGKQDTHCYCLGVYDKKHRALKEAEAEEVHRGGTKYEAEILEFDLNDSESCKYIKQCFKLIKYWKKS